MGGGQSKGKQKAPDASAKDKKKGADAAPSLKQVEQPAKTADNGPSVLPQVQPGTETAPVEEVEEISQSPNMAKDSGPSGGAAKEAAPPEPAPMAPRPPTEPPHAADAGAQPERAAHPVQGGSRADADETGDRPRATPVDTHAPAAAPLRRDSSGVGAAANPERATQLKQQPSRPSGGYGANAEEHSGGGATEAAPDESRRVAVATEPPAPKTEVGRKWKADTSIERLDADLFPSVRAPGLDSGPTSPVTPPRQPVYKREHDLLMDDDRSGPPPVASAGKWMSNGEGAAATGKATAKEQLYKSTLDDDDLMLIHDIEDELAL